MRIAVTDQGVVIPKVDESKKPLDCQTNPKTKRLRVSYCQN